MNTLLDAALDYARNRFPVFPISPGKKTPLTEHGFKDATLDKKQIRAWWKRWPDANIGIATGSVSSLFVLDVDVKPGKDGEKTLRSLINGHNTLPPTRVCRTPSGGRHIYFLLPKGKIIKSGTDVYGPGLDVRAEGGYVVAPPSVIEGRTYAWET